MTNIASTTRPALELYELGQRHTADGWLISDWSAGQSSIMQWSPDNVRVAADGHVELVLGRAPQGSARPYQGGEIQYAEIATTGTWGWTVQAPEMVSGAVFGMFTYSADWKDQPWVEFDFEFVGADTTKVHLAIHMEDATGKYVTLDTGGRKKSIIELGFDASKAAHTYEVTVTDKNAVFYVDGKVVGTFSGADMSGDVWNIGPMKSYIDLWAVAPAQTDWAGAWSDPGKPLVATIMAGEVRAGEFGSSYAAEAPVVLPAEPVEGDPDPADQGKEISNLVGSEGNDLLIGTPSDDTIYGHGGADTVRGGAGKDEISGGSGDDRLFGEAGDDRIFLDGGNDLIDGGEGSDWVLVTGAAGAKIDLARTATQQTGNGTDTVLNVENIVGGLGADRLYGSGGSNILEGNAGNDRLYGRGGNDKLSGGDGNDRLDGGSGDDFVFGQNGNDMLYLDSGNDTIDGGAGKDQLVIAGLGAATVDLGLKTAQLTGFGQDLILNVENVTGGSGADRLTGNSGSNYLVGNGGNDVLDGGSGGDKLYGGLGADIMFAGDDSTRDVFLFKSAADSSAGPGRDVVHDVVSGIDRFDFRGIDANTSAAGDQAFAYTGTVAAGHSVWTVKSGADLVLRGDVDGDRAADFEILVTDIVSLAGRDFWL